MFSNLACALEVPVPCNKQGQTLPFDSVHAMDDSYLSAYETAVILDLDDVVILSANLKSFTVQGLNRCPCVSVCKVTMLEHDVQVFVMIC